MVSSGESWCFWRLKFLQSPNLNIVRSRFFNAKFDSFWQLSQKVLKLLKSFIPHLKALIFSSLELQGQRARPPNRAAAPFEVKLDHFQLQGRGGSVWRPSPLSLELQRTEYQGFKMRY